MNDRGIVTSGQIFILLFISRIVMALIFSPIFLKIDSLWDFLLPMLISMVLSLIMLYPILCMYKQNHSMSISEYSNKHFGKAGNILTILYAVYFFMQALYSISSYSMFLGFIAPNEVQIWLIVLLLIITCIYAAFKGIEAISRLSGIIFAALIIIAIIFVSFLLPLISVNNYIPVEYMEIDKLKDTVIFTLSRMGDIAAIAILYPITKGNIIRDSIIWIISVFLFFISIILITVGALGEYLDNQMFPVYQSIEGSGSLQRLNPMFLSVLTAIIFCQISMLLYVISQCIKNISTEKSGRNFTIISGVLLFIICMILVQHNIATSLFNEYLYFIITFTFVFLFPLVIVIINKLKGKKTKKSVLKKALRIISLIVTISITAVLISGCNTTQLNQRFIVQGIGIDKEYGKYKITAIVLDIDNEEMENSTKLIYCEGKSVDEAILSLKYRYSKDILLNQCLFIIMNMDAFTDCRQSLSYFCDNNDILKNTNLFVSDKNAEQIIKKSTEEFNYKSSDINALADNQDSEQMIAQCSLLDYISFTKNKYSGIIVPYITINENINSLQAYESVVLNQNHKTKILNYNQTVGSLIINEKANEYTETIRNKNSINILYRIKDVNSDIILELIDNNLEVNISVDVSLDRGYQNYELKLIYNDIYHKINGSINKTLKESGCDIFSLYKILRSVDYNDFKNVDNWGNILKNSKTKIRITINK